MQIYVQLNRQAFRPICDTVSYGQFVPVSKTATTNNLLAFPVLRVVYEEARARYARAKPFVDDLRRHLMQIEEPSRRDM